MALMGFCFKTWLKDYYIFMIHFVCLSHLRFKMQENYMPDFDYLLLHVVALRIICCGLCLIIPFTSVHGIEPIEPSISRHFSETVYLQIALEVN